MQNNLFWFDGLDRTGKSSTIQFLKERLIEFGREVVVVESKTILGVRIPTLIGNFPDEIAYMLFWQAIRLQELGTIVPALEAGKVVLCDRGPFSQLAYDWWAGLDSVFKGRQDEIYFERSIKPTTAYIFTMPYSTFIERDDGKTVLTEKEYNKIQSSYITLGKKFANQMDIVFVDGNKPKDEAYNSVLEHLLVRLGEENE